MNRRHYIASLATLSTAAVAGCSSDEEPNGTEDPNGTDNPVGTENPNGAGTETPAEPTEEPPTALEAFQTELVDAGIEVDDAFADDELVVLDFITDAASEEELDDDAVTIAHALARVVDEFDEGMREVEAWALTEDYDYIGQFGIEFAWARKFAAGDLSEEEYEKRVVETIRR